MQEARGPLWSAAARLQSSGHVTGGRGVLGVSGYRLKASKKITLTTTDGVASVLGSIGASIKTSPWCLELGHFLADKL